jgi:hypothetical protein
LDDAAPGRYGKVINQNDGAREEVTLAIDMIRVDGIDGAYQVVREKTSGRDLLEENRIMFFEQTSLFRRCRFWLADFTNSDLAEVSGEDIRALRAIAAEAAALCPELAVAIVAPEDLQFALGRMWSTLTEGTGWRTSAFRSSADACRWLADILDCRFTPDDLPTVP